MQRDRPLLLTKGPVRIISMLAMKEKTHRQDVFVLPAVCPSGHQA